MSRVLKFKAEHPDFTARVQAQSKTLRKADREWMEEERLNEG
jgi:hypothetical protein